MSRIKTWTEVTSIDIVDRVAETAPVTIISDHVAAYCEQDQGRSDWPCVVVVVKLNGGWELRVAESLFAFDAWMRGLAPE